MAPKPSVQSKKHVARLERERRQARLLMWITAGVVLAVIGILAYGYIDINYLQASKPVASVNGEEISTKEFQARVTLRRNQILNQYVQYYQLQQMGMDVTAQIQEIEGQLNFPVIVGQQVMDSLIEEILIRQEAEKRGITVSEEEVQAFIHEQFEFFPNGTPTPTLTVTPFSYPTHSPEQLTFVTPTPNVTATPSPTATVNPSFTATPTTPPTVTPTAGPSPTPLPTQTPYTQEGFDLEFSDVVSGMKDLGLTEAQYRLLFKTELLRRRLYEQVTVDVPNTSEQVWARHILVSDEETARLILERLEAGEDFGELAREFSEDPGSAPAGGDLYWFQPDQMVPEFAEACLALDIGEISDPVQTQYGFHIIQKLGQADVPMTSSQWEVARQQAFQEFLAKLREEADIEINDNWVAVVPTTPGLQDLFGSGQ
ncbi:MAG: peptidylprolyl isomerase [Anaerolineales bacterium]